MLKQTTHVIAAATLVLGAASGARAGNDGAGDYKGGALFGPQPGQVFSYGWGGPYAYGYPPGVYGRGGRAFGYLPSLRAVFPTANWDQYYGVCRYYGFYTPPCQAYGSPPLP